MTVPFLVGDAPGRGRAAVTLRFMPAPFACRVQDVVVHRAHDFGAERGRAPSGHHARLIAL
jgi:hypothetical protein